MRTLARLVFLQRGNDVSRILMPQSWNAVVRIGVLVVVDPMATHAGVELLFTGAGVAGGACRHRANRTERRHARQQRQAVQSSKHPHLRFKGPKLRALMLKSGGPNCHSHRRTPEKIRYSPAPAGSFARFLL